MPSSRRAIWRTSIAGAVTILIAVGSAAADTADDGLWQALGISGTLRGTFFSHDFSFDHRAPTESASAWLTAEPERVWGVRAYADGRAQLEHMPRGSRFAWDLREGYLERSVGRIDLKIGRRILVWGRADKINPTDVWSVRDLTLIATDDEDQRLGAVAAQAQWHLGSVSLIGVWQPEWRAPIFPFPPLPAGIAARTVGPAHAEAQFGFKIDHSGSGVDWSLSYARVIDKTPNLRLESSTILDFVYQPMEMLGADAAVPVGQYGLRGEVAYKRQLQRGIALTATKYDDLFLVAGVERTFGGEFNVNVQYLYQRNYGFHEPADITTNPTTRLLMTQNDLATNQFARDMNGLSIHIIDRLLNETLSAELGGAVWFGRGGGAMQPKVSYAVSDRLQVIVGGQIFFGPGKGFFGEFHESTAVFAEGRWGI